MPVAPSGSAYAVARIGRPRSTSGERSAAARSSSGSEARRGDAEQAAGAHGDVGPAHRHLDLVAAAVPVRRPRARARAGSSPSAPARSAGRRSPPTPRPAARLPARESGEVVEARRLHLAVLREAIALRGERGVGRRRVEQEHEQRHLRLARRRPARSRTSPVRLRAEPLRDEDHESWGPRCPRGCAARRRGRAASRATAPGSPGNDLVSPPLPSACATRLRPAARSCRRRTRASTNWLPAHAVVVLDVGDGLGQRHLVAAAVRHAHHSRQAPPDEVDVGRELDARPGPRHEGEPHAVAGGQRVEEALRRLQHLAALRPGRCCRGRPAAGRAGPAARPRCC